MIVFTLSLSDEADEDVDGTFNRFFGPNDWDAGLAYVAKLLSMHYPGVTAEEEGYI